MNANHWRGVVLVLVATTATPSFTTADEFISEFTTDFDGWQQQWHKESASGTDGVVIHSADRGYLDGTSLEFDMGDGFGDDGTLWIERPLTVSAAQPTLVSLTFQLFNLEQSDLNAFQVKATIAADNPDEQADFETIGNTNTTLGWVPFAYDAVLPPTTDLVWVAVGIRVAWETPRVFWIDRVVVSTTTVPEPGSACLLAASVIGPLQVRRLGQRRSCR